MKTVLLLRHAKSSWDHPDLSDFERPLNARGLKAAPLMGEYMRSRSIQPDLILCSPAERASQTAAHVLGAARLHLEARFDRRIYEADAPRLLRIISEVEDAARTVLIIGHNPGLSDLLERLTNETRHLPTAALASIALDIGRWIEVRELSGQLEWLVTPRDLESSRS